MFYWKEAGYTISILNGEVFMLEVVWYFEEVDSV